MIEVELVGGEFDGVRINMPSEQEIIDVPVAFLLDGETVNGLEILQYERMDRRSDEGRPLYQFLRHQIGAFIAGEPSND